MNVGHEREIWCIYLLSILKHTLKFVKVISLKFIHAFASSKLVHVVLCMSTFKHNRIRNRDSHDFFQCSIFLRNFWSYIVRTFLLFRLQSYFQTFLRKMGNYQKHCNIDVKSMNTTEDIQEFHEQWVKWNLLLFAKKVLAKSEMKTTWFLLCRSFIFHCLILIVMCSL